MILSIARTTRSAVHLSIQRSSSWERTLSPKWAPGSTFSICGLPESWREFIDDRPVVVYISPMRCRLRTRFSVLVLLATTLISHRLDAQSQACLERESEEPTAAQNIKITVADVEFSGADPLTDESRTQLVNRVKKLDVRITPEDDDSRWLEQLQGPIRDAFLEQGYFRAQVEARPYLIRAEANERHYALRVEIISGPQYRLDEITFSGAEAFAIPELRKQLSLHHGDLFDVLEIHRAIDSMNWLYHETGFIDMVVEPETRIDHKTRFINVAFKVHEGKQYHVGTVEIYGLAGTDDQALRSQVSPGQVFDARAFAKFTEKYRAGHPRDTLSDRAIWLRRNAANGTVDIVVDFRPCPAT